MLNQIQTRLVELYHKGVKDDVKPNRKKMIVPILVALSLIATAGYAIWTYVIQDTSHVTVVSNQTQTFVSTFTQTTIDVTLNDVDYAEYIRVENDNGQIHNYTIVYDINKTDVEDTCTDYINDVDVTLSYANNTVFSVAQNGYVDVYVTYNATRQSCPQEITVPITITDITEY